MPFIHRNERILRATPSAAGPTLAKKPVWRWLCCASSAALLILLVVGFAVKCAEASWLLAVGFYSFSIYSCHFGSEFYYFGCPKPIIWYAWWLHFTTLGPFHQLRDTVGDHGSSRKDKWESETRFLLISGWFLDFILTAFWASMGLIICLFWACFQVTFCIGFRVGLLSAGALKTRFSCGKYCKNHVFAKIVLWWFESRFLVFFGGLEGGFSDISVLETGLKIKCFSRLPWGSWMAAQNKEMTGSGVKRSVWIGSNNHQTTSWVITLA